MRKNFTFSNFLFKTSNFRKNKNLCNINSLKLINNFKKDFSNGNNDNSHDNYENQNNSQIQFKTNQTQNHLIKIFFFNHHTKAKLQINQTLNSPYYTNKKTFSTTSTTTKNIPYQISFSNPKNNIRNNLNNFNNNNNKNNYHLNLNSSVIKTQKRSFCESNISGGFKEKEDYIYIISIRSKTLKSIRREPNAMISQYWESNKYNGLNFKDVQGVEQIYSKLEKEEKIASTLRVCSIFVKKKFYSKHLIDYFIDNCSEIAEDSLFNLNGFIYYINGLDLKPNQINFNPNFFKIIEENFFKEGILMDLLDMKVYMRFFYRFKNCFSQKLINYAERCLIYLLENVNSYTLTYLFDVAETMKFCFISGSDRCFQKIVDYFTKMILLKSTNFTEVVEYLKNMATLTGKVLRTENILNYDIKYEILVRGFDRIKGKIYEYISKEKVEINFLKNLLHLLIQNNSIGYFKGINFKDLIMSYIIKNENDIDHENLRALLRMMCWNRNFLLRYQSEINQLILSNLSALEVVNNSSLGTLYSYLRNSVEPNPAIRDFAELMLIKSFLVKGKDSTTSYPVLFLVHKFFFNEIIKKNLSGFLAFCLIEGNEKIRMQIESDKAEKNEFSKDNPLAAEEEENNA